jgi:hypothetical protein
MILGAVFGGPIVDLIRHDYKRFAFTYSHTNRENGKVEEREQEFSAWRTICFFGFSINIFLNILLCFYDRRAEDRFKEKDFDQGKFPD